MVFVTIVSRSNSFYSFYLILIFFKYWEQLLAGKFLYDYDFPYQTY